MIKILVVDDQFNDRELARDILEGQGFHVDTSSSGKEALEKLAVEPFDIVLTDLMMPEMNGLNLVQRIKESKYDVGVIVMTAYGTVGTATEAIKLGAYDYMVKPLDKNKIVVGINNCISAHKLSKEIKTLHQKMFNIEKMSTVSQITASIAHQVRNPLFAIQSTAEYLSEKYKNEPTAGELLEGLCRIISNSRQADEVIYNLLRTTKFDEIKLEKMSLSEVASKTVELVRPEVNRKNIKIVTEFSDKVCVFADNSYLQQCLLNVIMNSLEAFDALQQNKTITVRTYFCESVIPRRRATDNPANKFGCIEIEDNGKGIPQDVLTKVSEPFFTSKPGGTGIGLFFVHRVIMNYFSGDVRLETAVGKGTKVIISLIPA